MRFSVSKLEEEKSGLHEEVQFLRNASIVGSQLKEEHPSFDSQYDSDKEDLLAELEKKESDFENLKSEYDEQKNYLLKKEESHNMLKEMSDELAALLLKKQESHLILKQAVEQQKSRTVELQQKYNWTPEEVDMLREQFEELQQNFQFTRPLSDETVVAHFTWRQLKEMGVMDEDLSDQIFFQALSNE